MAQFYHAEAILRRSVGPANEKSIFTFGNLSELFWQDFREFYLGFLHRRQSCIVAVRVFGPEHANTVRTLPALLASDLPIGPDLGSALLARDH